MYTRVHTCTHIYKHAHMYTHVHVYYTLLHTCTCIYMYAHSLKRQVNAINKLSSHGMHFWDYGNAFLLEASRAGISPFFNIINYYN